jgi:hypothetical protein
MATIDLGGGGGRGVDFIQSISLTISLLWDRIYKTLPWERANHSGNHFGGGVDIILKII